MANVNNTTEPTNPAGVNTAHIEAEQLPMPGTIRFYGHHSGVLETGGEVTAWGYLPAILALAKTRRPYERTVYGEPFQTDEDGLGRLGYMAEQAEGAISDAIEIVGELLANCDTKEVDHNTFNKIGWLLCGLSDLRHILSMTRTDAEQHLIIMGQSST